MTVAASTATAHSAARPRTKNPRTPADRTEPAAQRLDLRKYVQQRETEKRVDPDAHPGGYLSTACLHGLHDYCNAYTGAAGTKIPAKCKFCGAACRCDAPGCHGLTDGPLGATSFEWLLDAATAEDRLEVAQVIADEIRAAYSTSGDRALLEAVAIALRHAGKAAQVDAAGPKESEPTRMPVRGSGDPEPL